MACWFSTNRRRPRPRSRIQLIILSDGRFLNRICGIFPTLVVCFINTVTFAARGFSARRGASNEVWPKKNGRPEGCAEFGLGRRCSVGRVSQGIHSRPRALPQAKLGATHVTVFMKQTTKRDRPPVKNPTQNPGRTPPASASVQADDPQGRRRVLAQWRGIDVTAQEKARALRYRPMSELVPRILQGMGLDRRRSEAEIARVWNHLLDPTITAHAQPTGIRRGTLFVTVDSSVWLDEIVRYRYREILERLQHSFGKDMVARISFRAG